MLWSAVQLELAALVEVEELVKKLTSKLLESTRALWHLRRLIFVLHLTCHLCALAREMIGTQLKIARLLGQVACLDLGEPFILIAGFNLAEDLLVLSLELCPFFFRVVFSCQFSVPLILSVRDEAFLCL